MNLQFTGGLYDLESLIHNTCMWKFIFQKFSTNVHFTYTLVNQWFAYIKSVKELHLSMSKNQQKICFLWKMQFMLNQYFVSKLDLFTLVFKCLEFEFVLNIHQSKLNKMPIQVLIVHFSQSFKSTGFTNFQFIMTCKMCIPDFEGHNCMHIFLIFLNWKIDILSKTCSMD